MSNTTKRKNSGAKKFAILRVERDRKLKAQNKAFGGATARIQALYGREEKPKTSLSGFYAADLSSVDASNTRISSADDAVPSSTRETAKD